MASEDNETLEPTTRGIFEMMHTIEDLDPASDYEAIVVVENSFGWSEPPEVFHFNTKKGIFIFTYKMKSHI